MNVEFRTESLKSGKATILHLSAFTSKFIGSSVADRKSSSRYSYRYYAIYFLSKRAIQTQLEHCSATATNTFSGHLTSVRPMAPATVPVRVNPVNVLISFLLMDNSAKQCQVSVTVLHKYKLILIQSM